MPSNEPLYTSTITPPVPPDRPLTATCAQVATLTAPFNGLACGNYGVNTMQPIYQPSGLFGAKIPAQTNPTIGDRLTGAGVDWAWYAGGWSNANGDTAGPGYTNGSAPSATVTGCSDPYVDPGVGHWPECPNNLFQYHHQPFNYFANFSTATPQGQANRTAHLRDEVEFQDLAASSAKECMLKPVSFVKPFGTENEHPGYASEPDGSDHLVDLIKSIEDSKCGKDTMIVVVYDEFGGQWDHVSTPGSGQRGWTARRVGSRDAHRVAGHRSAPERLLRGRQCRARHDLRPDDHRASLRPGPARDPRRGSQRPLDRLRREEAEAVTRRD